MFIFNGNLPVWQGFFREKTERAGERSVIQEPPGNSGGMCCLNCYLPSMTEGSHSENEGT